MISTATVNSQQVKTVAVADEQLTQCVMLVEWLVKLQHQISRQQGLIEEQQQKIKAQEQEIEQLKEERDKKYSK
jgi:Tfp pilus assembly protein PilN